MSSGEIFALRKQKRAEEALELARAEYSRNASDIWFLRAYGWVLYDHAKKLVEAFEAKQLSPTALTAQLTPYMREFARMAEPLRGDSTFSQMLNLALKASKGWPNFLGFAKWAGTSAFSDSDKTPYVNEQGKTIDSLQTRFVRAICREAVSEADDSQANVAAVEWAREVLAQSLKDSPNDQWLNYYQSKLHLRDGESDKAIQRLLPVLRRQSRASWPWALLGEILEQTQPDNATTCYAHAVQLAREEQEVAKTRIRLAERLAHAERYGEAAHEAQLALKYRDQHGYKVPQELAQLLSSDWYQHAAQANGLRPMPIVEAAARSLLRQLDVRQLIYVPGVIDHINEDKALSYVATSADSGMGLLHRKFPGISNLPAGTLVEIGCAEPGGPPVEWRRSEADSLPNLCEMLSGSAEKQEGKDFAFIRTSREDVFVPPTLARDLKVGQRYDVNCLAVKRANKQGKIGWRAVKLLQLSIEPEVNSTRGDEAASS